ncbi:MAG TPA: HAD-IA family hydrolase [Pseudomonadota bacterium]|nr:HAD-IA family hydrolase [Pseudomonadota bacterium]
MSRPPKRAMLLDLDDTLYDYHPAEQVARRYVLAQLVDALGQSAETVRRFWDASRQAVKQRVGPCGASHSRLLYLHELVHRAGRLDLLGQVRAWERGFWRTFLAHAQLRPGARELLVGWRRCGHGLALVSDLTLDIQLWKLEHFDLLGFFDAVVVSEEVATDKPGAAIFQLAAARLGVPLSCCIVVGDSAERDVEGAKRLGLPYVRVKPSSGDADGQTLVEVAQELLV